MDTDTLVENRISDGEKLVEELPRHGFEVTAAFWLKPSATEKWSFYLVAPAVDADGSHNTYRRLHPIVRAMPQPFGIDPLEIRLVGPSSPIGREATAICARGSGARTSPIRWGGKSLGGVIVDGTYFYSVPPTTP